jgi:beta-lactamase regulating signal transducer with metallopeptidase domain
VIVTSLFVSLLVALFLPLRPLLRRAIGSEWLCALWVALLIRLLLPWPLETRFGLMGYHPRQTALIEKSAPAWKITAGAPAKPNAITNSPQVAASPFPGSSSAIAPPLNVPLIVWLCGSAFALIHLVWRWRQIRVLAVTTQPVANPHLLSLFSAIPLKWRRDVELRVTGAVNVPTLAGVLRPQIWMPQSWPAKFTDDELTGILLHEIGHARRGDLAIQWLFAVAQCLHWFNPIVWLAARAARFDREMACDAWVLSRNGASTAYGATLLKTVGLLRARPDAWPAAVAMASGRRALRARIGGIGKFRTARAWPGLIGTIFMVAALAAITTSHTTVGQTPIPTPPAEKATVNLATATGTGGAQIKIETKFVSIEESTWKELCAENPEFQRIAREGGFAAADSTRDTSSGRQAGATTETELNALGASQWQFKDGAWETSQPLDLLPFFESEDRVLRILRALEGERGVDLLSSPTVTTRAGQRAKIEVCEEFNYPSEWKRGDGAIYPASRWVPLKFVTKNVGVSLDLQPNLEKDGTVNLKLDPEITDFLGFVYEKNGSKWVSQKADAQSGSFLRPIFSISQGRTQISIQPHQTAILGGVRSDRQSNWSNRFGAHSNAAEPAADPIREVVLILVTPTIVSGDQSASAAPNAGSERP